MDGDGNEIKDSSWESVMFVNDDIAVVGQRLGVSYLQSTMDYVNLNVDSHHLKLYQTSMGIMAISGVVWDAGFCLSDYMISNREFTSVGEILDLGCGTGVCGLTSLLLGASAVTFSDMCEPPSLDDNFSQLSEDFRLKSRFVAFDWKHPLLCLELMRPVRSADMPLEELAWDTVLCSDLLYDQKAHEPLLRVLKQMHFKKAVFSYKKRHDVPEKEFFRMLGLFCTIRVVKPDSFELRNLNPKATSGLFVVIVVPIQV